MKAKRIAEIAHEMVQLRAEMDALSAELKDEYGKCAANLIAKAIIEILVGNTIRRKSETPLTSNQLRAGDWFCRSISEVTRLALLAKGFKSMSGKWPCEMHDYKYCSMGRDGHAILLREVDLESYAHDRLSEGVTLREIRRVADQFYYV